MRSLIVAIVSVRLFIYILYGKVYKIIYNIHSGKIENGGDGDLCQTFSIDQSHIENC